MTFGRRTQVSPYDALLKERVILSVALAESKNLRTEKLQCKIDNARILRLPSVAQDDRGRSKVRWMAGLETRPLRGTIERNRRGQRPRRPEINSRAKPSPLGKVLLVIHQSPTNATNNRSTNINGATVNYSLNWNLSNY